VNRTLSIRLVQENMIPTSGDNDFRYTWTNWDDARNNYVKVAGKEQSITRLVLEWLEKRDKQHPADLWLYGPVGMGKDHLANIATVLLTIRNHWQPARLEWLNYINQMRESYSGGPEVDTDRFTQADVLIVSDIDRTKTTSFVLEQMGNLIRARKGKVTIYTSNTSMPSFYKKLRHSTKRGEDKSYLQTTADTIESRLAGQVTAQVLCTSKYGDWRKQHGR